MAYTKTVWVDNSTPAIDAEKLNKIEQGIYDAHTAAVEAAAGASSLYTWIKYADDINGGGLSDSPLNKSYMGTAYNKTSAIESEDPADYTWVAMGTMGLPGNDGLGIVSIQRTSGNGAPGTIDTYTITYTDGSTSTYDVSNGANGEGVRGPTELIGEGTVWSDQAATDAFAAAGYNLLQFDRYTIPGDAYTPKISKYWSGAGWADYAEYVDGNLVATGTIHGNKIAANTITTAELAASSINLSGFINDANWTDDTVANQAATEASEALSTANTAQSLASTSIQPGSIITTINNSPLETTTIRGGKITTGSITATQIDSNYLYAGRFYCSDANSNGYSTFKNYTTTTSTVAVGGVRTGSAYGQAVYGRYDGTSSTTGCAGVYGLTSNSSAYGVYGSNINGVGIYGNGSTYGIVTDDVCWATGGFHTPGAVYDFTGSHSGITQDTGLEVGDICSVEGTTFNIGVDQVFPVVNSSTAVMDKKVIGVVSKIKDNAYGVFKDSKLIYDRPEFNEEGVVDVEPGINDDYLPFVEALQNTDYTYVGINALGEGMINVCSENGNIEAGDYICSSSSVPGKGMKQADDIVHNYTVAKALESVDWSTETSTTKMIACTYHCG